MIEGKRIGSVTEIKIKLSFVELGYNVSTPYGDCERYDFIADIKGRLLRIQCKTAETIDDGRTFDVDFRRIRNSERYHKGKRLYGSDEIDYFATHFRGKTYLIPAQGNGIKKRFRIMPMLKGARNKKANWAKDYEIENVIKKLIKEERE